MVFKLPQKKDFAHKIYKELLKVPAGKVTTYGALAHAVGTRAYRAVGGAMNKNPYSPEVPCHRVIASDGSIGGFAFGTDKKVKLLAREGVKLVKGKVPEEQILRSL